MASSKELLEGKLDKPNENRESKELPARTSWKSKGFEDRKEIRACQGTHKFDPYPKEELNLSHTV